MLGRRVARGARARDDHRRGGALRRRPGLVERDPTLAVRAQTYEQVAEECRLALEQVLLRLQSLSVGRQLEESLSLARVDRQAGGDAVRGLARRYRPQLIHDRAVAALVVGDGHDRDEILAIGFDRDGRAL